MELHLFMIIEWERLVNGHTCRLVLRVLSVSRTPSSKRPLFFPKSPLYLLVLHPVDVGGPGPTMGSLSGRRRGMWVVCVGSMGVW